MTNKVVAKTPVSVASLPTLKDVVPKLSKTATAPSLGRLCRVPGAPLQESVSTLRKRSPPRRRHRRLRCLVATVANRLLKPFAELAGAPPVNSPTPRWCRWRRWSWAVRCRGEPGPTVRRRASSDARRRRFKSIPISTEQVISFSDHQQPSGYARRGQGTQDFEVVDPETATRSGTFSRPWSVTRIRFFAIGGRIGKCTSPTSTCRRAQTPRICRLRAR